MNYLKFSLLWHTILISSDTNYSSTRLVLLIGHITALYTAHLCIPLARPTDAYLLNIFKKTLRPHSPLSEISTAALILHIQHPFCQSHSVKGLQSTHIPGSLVFSICCS